MSFARLSPQKNELTPPIPPTTTIIFVIKPDCRVSKPVHVALQLPTRPISLRLIQPIEYPRRHEHFLTERLQLAIYLHAAERLLFLRCEVEERGKVRFVFDDPSNAGPQVELEFDRGAEVAASDLFASQKYLRSRMSEALENRKNENYARNKSSQ